MNPLTFKKSSWHYRLVDYWMDTPAAENETMCEYVWQVVGALLRVVLTSAFVTLAAFVMVIMPIVSAIWLLHHGWAVKHKPSFLSLGEMGVGLDIIVLTPVIVVHFRRKKVFKTAKQPSFVKEAYRSIKDKVCTRINFE
jgi:hypothetical protein